MNTLLPTAQDLAHWFFFLQLLGAVQLALLCVWVLLHSVVERCGGGR